MALAHTLTRASRRNRWVPSLLNGLSSRSSREGTGKPGQLVVLGADPGGEHAGLTPAGRTETPDSRRQNALDPGFMTFQLARRIRTVVLMVQACPESGFRDVPPGRGPRADREHGADGADVTGLRSAPLGAARATEFSRKKCFENLSKRLFRE
jgi:hypothetical protein